MRKEDIAKSRKYKWLVMVSAENLQPQLKRN